MTGRPLSGFLPSPSAPWWRSRSGPWPAGHRLHLRLDEVRLRSAEALEVPDLHQPFCKLEGARDVALGITEDFVAQFRATVTVLGTPR